MDANARTRRRRVARRPSHLSERFRRPVEARRSLPRKHLRGSERPRRDGARREDGNGRFRFKAGERAHTAAVMRRSRSGFRRMTMPIAVILMEVQDQDSTVGLTEHMHDGGPIGAGERNRGREHTQRIGDDHQGHAQTPQPVSRWIGSHRADQYAETRPFGRDRFGMSAMTFVSASNAHCECITTLRGRPPPR